LSEEIDEKGLEKVAERYLRRKEIQELGLSLDEVKSALLQHARQRSGCVNCIYSAPYKGKLSWTTRSCVLGLNQNTCGDAYKPIVKVAER